MSEHEIETVRNSRDPPSDAVRDIICDVTPPHFNFWGQNEDKNCIHSQRRTGDPRQLPRGRTCDKTTFRAITRSARRPMSVCPSPSRRAPG